MGLQWTQIKAHKAGANSKEWTCLGKFRDLRGHGENSFFNSLLPGMRQSSWIMFLLVSAQWWAVRSPCGGETITENSMCHRERDEPEISALINNNISPVLWSQEIYRHLFQIIELVSESLINVVLNVYWVSWYFNIMEMFANVCPTCELLCSMYD